MPDPILSRLGAAAMLISAIGLHGTIATAPAGRVRALGLRLAEAALSVCEPENADDVARAHTLRVLAARFEAILTDG